MTKTKKRGGNKGARWLEAPGSPEEAIAGLPKGKKVLVISDVAQAMRRNEITVLRAVHEGELVATTRGTRQFKFERDDVVAFFRRRYAVERVPVVGEGRKKVGDSGGSGTKGRKKEAQGKAS